MPDSVRIDTKAAALHFTQTDPRMAAMLTTALADPLPITIPEPRNPEGYFERTVRSIVSQQISVKAAASVFARLETCLGEVTPDAVRKHTEEELRACGLSGQKTRYIKTNAKIWHDLPIYDFQHMPDEAVIEELTKLYGIGRWTAEMFLMFSLARPDVFSYGDLGLMQSIYEQYTYRPHWKRKIKTTVDAWAPHRTIASLVLWHQKDNEPVTF